MPSTGAELKEASSWSICKMLASFDKYPQRLKAYKSSIQHILSTLYVLYYPQHTYILAIPLKRKKNTRLLKRFSVHTSARGAHLDNFNFL